MEQVIQNVMHDIAVGIVIGYAARQAFELYKDRKRRKFRSAVLKKKISRRTSNNLREIARSEMRKYNQLSN